MLQAAFRSRSWRLPHFGHRQLLSFSVNPSYTYPHLLQVFELGAKRSISMRLIPYHLHLYSRILRNIPNEASDMLLASFLFCCMPFTFRSSMHIVRTWLSCVSMLVTLWIWSLRWLLILSCIRANFIRALSRFAEPSCFLLNCRCLLRNSSSEWARFLGY